MFALSKILTSNFRNLASKSFDFSSNLVFICGKNGSGKTSLIEAISLLGNPFIKDSSLRGAHPSEIAKSHNLESEKNSDDRFSVFAKIEGSDIIETLSVLYEKIHADSKVLWKKSFAINEKEVKGKVPSDIKHSLVNFIWLTPEIELMFVSDKKQRREYLDRIVSFFHTEHSANLNKYNKLLRERLAILKKEISGSWLNIVEAQIAELAIRILFARDEVISLFNQTSASTQSYFPKISLTALGDIEDELKLQKSGFEIEEYYKEKLLSLRQRDLITSRTSFGVHRTDLSATMISTNCKASLASTGQQKLIMISITLGCAKLSIFYKNKPAILLFDEVFSHLDERNRELIIDEISSIGAQSFFTLSTNSLIPNTTAAKQGQILSLEN